MRGFVGVFFGCIVSAVLGELVGVDEWPPGSSGANGEEPGRRIGEGCVRASPTRCQLIRALDNDTGRST